jgi:Protein of unknown function (DUF3540)
MSRNRSATARLSQAEGLLSVAFVAALDDDDARRVHVRSASAAAGPCASARLAVAHVYRPAPGDRILVADVAGELCVMGVLDAANPPETALADGSVIRARDGGAEILDPAGRLVLRYENGAVEIAAPTGDLTLAAPSGKVIVRAAGDVEIEAARDVRQRAGRSVEVLAGRGASASRLRVGAGGTAVETPRLQVSAVKTEVTSGEATITAGRITTVASRLTQQVEIFELTATRLIEKTRDTFRDAADLSQTRVGRARTIVKNLYALYSGRTAMVSEKDTSIDGTKVLLG